ncbi:hypothetical protein JGF25_23625, partial [Salmonella enterica subsp. enterica serovar Mbandaka]|nr:hypothetical protein [Salmonella enterica subsp. enterica serovar Mbandaka]
PGQQAPRSPLGNQGGLRKKCYWNGKKKIISDSKKIKDIKRTGKYEEIRISTTNVRGIWGKEPELAKEMQKFRLNIVGISETKQRLSGGSVVSDGYHMNYAGVKKGHVHAGVAIAYDKTMADGLIKWEPVNERILWTVFRLNNIDFKVVVVQKAI